MTLALLVKGEGAKMTRHSIFYFHVKEAFYKPSLTSQFSFKLKPGQKEAVNCLLEGKDVFTVISTGFRKSFICQLLSMAIE